MRHESVGWVFFEDDTSVALCLSRGMEAADEDDPNVCDVMQIPKVAITSRTLLEPKKGTRR
jgi:hypothetical protein